ncbi:MAG: hypothetical protein C4325_01900 [Blastocatellia bacterium]
MRFRRLLKIRLRDDGAVFGGDGARADLDAIVSRMAEADVIFLGELHDDSVGHQIEYEIFRRLVEKYNGGRKVVLSMEMFERDVQIVLDEYLGGMITESHFLLSSRAWGNYKTDYRPLVELAKERSIPVVAANAPRRYVNMVSRNGRQVLDRLSPRAKEWLPPLPYRPASEAYAAKFRALMGESRESKMGLGNILDSQALWDATMAHSIARVLENEKNPLVVHLNGGFHTESRLGTVEQLLGYRPQARIVVVTIRSENDFRTFDPQRHKGIGDFVILTDAAAPRSQR